MGDNILTLPVGADFATLAKADSPWPTTAAKAMGYKFKGYKLTADDRPTFLYRLNDIKIEDFPNPIKAKEPGLRRNLKLSSSKPPATLYFRAGVATKIKALGDGWYRLDGWKMKLESKKPPQIRHSGGKDELLVPVSFTGGRAEIVQVFLW
jgi:hypothetical protein